MVHERAMQFTRVREVSIPSQFEIGLSQFEIGLSQFEIGLSQFEKKSASGAKKGARSDVVPA
jgi:hypothetical protein